MFGTREDSAADDRTLLARHLSGDAGAFGLLVERHRDRLALHAAQVAEQLSVEVGEHSPGHQFKVETAARRSLR